MTGTAPRTGRRPLTAHDERFVFDVFCATRGPRFEQAGLEPPLLATLLAQQFRAQREQYRAGFPGADFDLVLADGEPIGYLYACRRPGAFALIDVALAPEHRGRGHGTRVVTELIEQAARAGEPLAAHVEKGARAWALWQRLGFRVKGDEGVYLAIERPPGPLPRSPGVEPG